MESCVVAHAPDNIPQLFCAHSDFGWDRLRGPGERALLPLAWKSLANAIAFLESGFRGMLHGVQMFLDYKVLALPVHLLSSNAASSR